MRNSSKTAALCIAFPLGALVAACTGPQYRLSVDAQPSTAPPRVMAPTAATPARAGLLLSDYDPYARGAANCPEGGTDGGSQCAHLIPPSSSIPLESVLSQK